MSMLGYLNEQHRRFDVALRQHDDAVPILREIGHLQGLAHALNNRGANRQHLGMFDVENWQWAIGNCVQA